MKVITALALFSLAAGAQAQAPAGSAARGHTEPRRAPLAHDQDLEPAVDVGGTRVAVIDRAPPPAPAAASKPAESSATKTAQPSASTAPPSSAARTTTPTASSQAAPAPKSGNPRVVDSIDLGTTSITGNQELPKVLYIVPWKKSDLGDLVGRPVNTLLDEVLTPVDPEVFERHLEYYETLNGKGQEE